jgi:hypothetical protein
VTDRPTDRQTDRQTCSMAPIPRLSRQAAVPGDAPVCLSVCLVLSRSPVCPQVRAAGVLRRLAVKSAGALDALRTLRATDALIPMLRASDESLRCAPLSGVTLGLGLYECCGEPHATPGRCPKARG